MALCRAVHRRVFSRFEPYGGDGSVSCRSAAVCGPAAWGRVVGLTTYYMSCGGRAFSRTYRPDVSHAATFPMRRCAQLRQIERLRGASVRDVQMRRRSARFFRFSIKLACCAIAISKKAQVAILIKLDLRRGEPCATRLVIEKRKFFTKSGHKASKRTFQRLES